MANVKTVAICPPQNATKRTAIKKAVTNKEKCRSFPPAF
jgi:hypothetical protein